MARALVKALNVQTPDQFKTDWSQFMKQNIAMNRMVMAQNLVLDKSSAKLTFIPAIPKVMQDEGKSGDGIYMFVYIRNDANIYDKQEFSPEAQDFSVDSSLSPGVWREMASPQEVAITAANYTVGNKYDVFLVFSAQEIRPEVNENAWDRPYVALGAACEIVFEVECIA